MKPVESEPFQLNYSSLVEQAGQGSHYAMGQLAQVVKPRVFAYLCQLASNFDIAEDLTQDVLLEMVRSIRNLRQPSCFWGWLYRIAFNQFQTHCRRHKTRQSAEQALIAHMIQMQQSWQDQQKELSGAVWAAIQRLEHQNQSILKLRCFDQHRYADMADVLDTSEKNIRVRFYRAKQALKKELIRNGFNLGA
jgi:RNA polymerase sigma-70 factor (ECF subfamily)